MSELQSGIVAFLFTDIEGSTRLWEAAPEAMSAALSRHDELLQGVIEAAGGRVFKTAGDAFCAVFPTPAAAITAATAGQRALAAEPWPAAVPLRVRMAIHAGHAEVREDDYVGPPLNRVARLLATAHGEQIVVSRAASELSRTHLPSGTTLRGLGEFALKDLQQPERIFQVVASGLREHFPPLRTPERLLRNLPTPANPLIGREDAIQAARAAFGLRAAHETRGALSPSAARLVTLTGPGGTGKTRLALHLARDLGMELADGAVFVPLAAISDPALAPVTIAGALDLGESGGESPREALFEQLRDRRLLLVLDNFEQVMGAAGFIADLLEHCPNLLILATSRERLSVRGEVELPLAPLPLPALPGTGPSSPRQAPSVDDIRQSEAVQLFVARAQGVKPEFDVTEENARAIAEICVRLDGLPLAIELAAARVRLLSPQALLDRFERRLDLLSRGPRDLPERQQTMRDTIAWSYDLLEPAEQRLFASLSIFVGGAALSAATEIAQGLDAAGEIEALESLADKSLLRIHDEPDEPRLWMLGTIRDFARERLLDDPDYPRIADQHAAYYLAMAEEAEPLLAGREQTAWLDRLDHDLANLRAAIAWFREQHQPVLALRLAAALWRFWWLRGDIGEGRALLESLLNAAGSADPALRAKALNGAGVLAESQGDLECAARRHDESLAISRETGDLRAVAWSLNNLGVVEISQGRLDRARALIEENLTVAEQAGDPASIATALIDLGQVAHHQGDRERAVSLWTRSLALFRSVGDESHTARALNNLGTVAGEEGDLQRAHALLVESLAHHRSVGDRQGIASTLNNLAGVVNSLGDPDTAIGLFLESHLLASEGGNRLYAAIALENLASLERARGTIETATVHYRDALRLYQEVYDDEGIVSCLTQLASIASGGQASRSAALLLAVAQALCDKQPEIAPAGLADLRQSLAAELGDEEFAALCALGSAMSLDEAIERAAPPAMSRGMPHLA